MRLMGTKVHMTTTFHPQSDDQTEASNHIIIMYLHCFIGGRPRQWLHWLSWAEYIYNTAYQSDEEAAAESIAGQRTGTGSAGALAASSTSMLTFPLP